MYFQKHWSHKVFLQSPQAVVEMAHVNNKCFGDTVGGNIHRVVLKLTDIIH